MSEETNLPDGKEAIRDSIETGTADDNQAAADIPEIAIAAVVVDQATGEIAALATIEEVPVLESGQPDDSADSKEVIASPDKIETADTAKPASLRVWRKKIPAANSVYWKALAIVAIIIILIFAYYRKLQNSDDSGTADSLGNVTVSGSQEQGKISIVEESMGDISLSSGSASDGSWPKGQVTAYFSNSKNNPNSGDCGLVYPLARETDKKYDSNMMNAISGLLSPLSPAEKAQGFMSVIPVGTALKYLKLDDSGVLTANFSGALGKAAGSCAVTAIRAQIDSTLKQFAAVKSVVICIDDNCQPDKVLQP